MKNPVERCIELARKYHGNKDIQLLIMEMEKVNREVFGPLKRPYKFELRKSKDAQFYGVLVSPNGKIMDQTETMVQKASVVKNFRKRQSAYSTAEITDKTKKA